MADPHMERRQALRAVARQLRGFGLYLALSVVLLAPLSLRSASRLPDDGDSLQGLWITWWSSTHLWSGRDLLDANAYYPHPHGLLYSEPRLSEGLLGWPLFVALDNRVLASNLLLLVTLALTAWSTHLLLRELTGSAAGAVAGALLFSFSAYTQAHLPRGQLVTLQWLPLALLGLHGFFAGGRTRAAWLWAGASVLLAWGCFYYVVCYGVLLAVLLPAYLAAHRATLSRGRLAALTAAGLCATALVAAIALPYVRLFRRYEFRAQPLVRDVSAFLTPPPGTLWAGSATTERAAVAFLGFVALALAAWGAWSARRPGTTPRVVVLGYAAAGALCLLLAGGPRLVWQGADLGPGPYRLLQLATPFAHLRDPDRIAVISALALALFVAFGTGALCRRLGSRARAVSTLVLSGLLLSEQWAFRHPFLRGVEIPVSARTPGVYAWLATRPRAPVAELPPFPARFVRFNALDAFFSTRHGQTLLFGWPSFYPPAFELLQWELRDFPDATSLTLLAGLGVPIVVVHPARWEERREERVARLAEYRDVLALLHAFPEAGDPLSERYRLGAELALAVRPLERESAPRECACREIPRDALRVRANGASPPELALDGRRATRWTTGEGQREGFFFELRFDRPRVVTRVEMELAFPWGEFPRNLKLSGRLGDRARWLVPRHDPWYTLALVRQLVADPSRARLRLDFEPAQIELLRMQLDATEPGLRPWSIPELHVFETTGPDG